MQKVILFYKFVPVKDPEAIKLWQKRLCQSLKLKGRIIISSDGINGTLGGDIKDLKAYVKEYKQFSLFKNTTFKWSTVDSSSIPGVFPKLSVKVRKEIVTFGSAELLQVDENGVVGGGKHLKPKDVHKLINERGEGEVVFFDGRNAFEASIGKFKNAIVSDVRHTRNFIKELEDPKYNDIKDKPVVTYCTGGVRCEVLSKLMIDKGFKEVYQMDGGIVKYGEEFGDDGFWEGSLYVFDGRMTMNFSDKTKVIGVCSICSGKTSNFENCQDKSCNELILICEDCYKKTDNYCYEHANKVKASKSQRAL